jgi:hypothetical protein
MKRLAGQASRTLGWVLHHTGMIVITVFFVIAVVFGGFAYRLSRGPVEIPWITGRLASIVSGQGIDIHIDKAALAWGGYRQGGAVPLYLRLEGITATNATGVTLATIRSGKLVFLPSALIGGRAPILVSSTDSYFQGSNVPVAMQAAIELNGLFSFAHAAISVQLGPGDFGAAGDTLPISTGHFRLDVTPRDVALTGGVLSLAPRGQSRPVMGVSGAGHLDNGWTGAVTLTADRLAADDLAAYWPPGLLVQTRQWVTGNISSGIATGAKITVGLAAPETLASLRMTSAAGGFDASGLDVGWIPHAAPIQGVSGTLTITDDNDIDIKANAGALGGLSLAGGTMHIAGLLHHEQDGSFNLPVTGALAGALAVLAAPPLNLLRAAPPELLAATGDVAGTITCALPLRGDVTLGQVDLHVNTTLTNVTLPTPAPGLSFADGSLTLVSTLQLLTLQGSAMLAGAPATITTSAAFGAGQPVIDFLLQSKAAGPLLGRFGLSSKPDDDTGLAGAIPFSIHVTQNAGGAGAATLQADLTPGAAGIAALGWSKKPGAAGHVTIDAVLSGQSVAGIKTIDAAAPNLDIQARPDPANRGRLVFSRLHVGATMAQGTLTAPGGPAKPWQAVFSGPVLDITAILNPEPAPKAKVAPAKPAPAAKPEPPSGPLWSARLNFATFILAAHGAPALKRLDFSGTGEGATLLTADATAAGAADQPIAVTVRNSPGALHPQSIKLTAADGGNLLRALGAYGNLEGGALALNATTDDAGTTGTLHLQNFRLLQAPGFTKILQSLTVYGAAAAASGPGLAFDRAVAPFAIADNVLTLSGARAFSSSLGFTAAGTIDLVSGDTNLSTTVIPAYALNVLPGEIPVIGKLFSAEKGGGLFAVRAHISGTLTDPDVTVNPLSALTPGVLRDVFGTAPTAK